MVIIFSLKCYCALVMNQLSELKVPFFIMANLV